MTDIAAIALVGAGGKMGREIARASMGRRDLRITAALEHPSSDVLGKDAGEVAGIGSIGVTITSDMTSAFGKADVVIDLSMAEATRGVIESAMVSETPLVCGTTGLEDAVSEIIDSAAVKIPILYASNLSPAVAVMHLLLEKAVDLLREGYDVELVEMHHRDKIDAPSGTAMSLARSAANSLGVDPKQSLRFGRIGRAGPRSEGEIGVHAVRGGGVFGEHVAIMAGRYEQLEIAHRAYSRTVFAQGALRAALFLCGKPPGRYAMTDVLGWGG